MVYYPLLFQLVKRQRKHRKNLSLKIINVTLSKKIKNEKPKNRCKVSYRNNNILIIIVIGKILNLHWISGNPTIELFFKRTIH